MKCQCDDCAQFLYETPFEAGNCPYVMYWEMRGRVTRIDELMDELDTEYVSKSGAENYWAPAGWNDAMRAAIEGK